MLRKEVFIIRYLASSYLKICILTFHKQRVRMKTIPLLLIFIFFLSSCDNRQNATPESKTTSDSVIVYDINKYEEAKRHAQLTKKRLVVIDMACINGKKRALKDSKKGQLTYYFFGDNFTNGREVKSVKELFLEKGIKTDYAYTSATCTPLMGGEEFDDLCYEKTMNKEFEKRYGKTFTDSMMVVKDQKKLECSGNKP
jgi:hypothetical protein